MKRTPARTMFALLLAVVLVLGLAAPALAATTMRSVQKLTVNGEAVECDKYNIDGYNYFKLRDLAMLLTDTGSRFSVDYDTERDAVVIRRGAEYAPIGGELAPAPEQPEEVWVNESHIAACWANVKRMLEEKKDGEGHA